MDNFDDIYDRMPQLKPKDLKGRNTVLPGSAINRQIQRAQRAKQNAEERLQKLLMKEQEPKKQKIMMTQQELLDLQDF